MALTFTLQRSVEGATQLDALEGVDRATFLEAATMHRSGEYATPGDWAREMAAELDEDPEDQVVLRYVISDDAGPRFVMWYFTMSDDGSVYDASDGSLIGAHMVQGGFQVHDPETATEQLARDLRAGFDRAMKS